MWFQLKIEYCPTEEVEQFSEALEELGALSITLSDKNDDPVLEPEPGTTPLWPEVIIHALFAQAEEAQHTKAHLALTRPALECHLEVLADKDWERVWMDDFKPQRFGDRLWICPTWHTPPEPAAVNLMLDPGLAFGTGTHPTTSLCLTWLEQAELSDQAIIDYGCGSGILSLAALKLGAKTAQAVDIDNQALQATYNNALSNNINSLLVTTDSQPRLYDLSTTPKELNVGYTQLPLLFISKPEELKDPVDLIIANILLTPLISLKERFHHLLFPNAHLVVSGLLAEQTEALIKAYESLFTLITTEYRDGWALIVFARI